MFSLRWEVTPLETPYAAPRGDVLWPPIASGIIQRDEMDHATSAIIPITDVNVGVYGPSEIITIPSPVDGWSSLILCLESFGIYDWIVTLAPRGVTPQAAPPLLPAVDPVPTILVPASRVYEAGARSREIRSVRPGSSFIARPRLFLKPPQG